MKNLTDEQISIIESLYNSGISAKKISSDMGTSQYYVELALKIRGVRMRTISETNSLRRVQYDEKELILLDDQAVLSHREIAARLGISEVTVERHLRKMGRYSKKGRGSRLEKNYFWNGGVTKDSDGYVLVKSPDHPFRNNCGYVRKHRLVMEEFLGRYLGPKEVVHHKNGILDDNRIDNLQVFPRNSDHLRHELTGKTPNYTPDGLRRMRENALRVNLRRSLANQKKLKNDVHQ